MAKITIKKILYHINVFYARHIESLPYRNWFNPLVTLYLNFRCFPLRQAWRLPVFVYGWPKLFSLVGSMECVDECYTGMVELNRTIDGMPNHPGPSTAIYLFGKIIFHGKCFIHTFNKITVARTGVLELGKDTKIMCAVNITAYKSVRIGNNSWIVHRCQVMDTNYHFVADFKHGRVNQRYKPIIIGDYCWICNSSTISGGAVIPNKTIVASNSLVNKDMSDIPEESVIGGQPAKLISTGYRRVDSNRFERIIMKWLREHPEALFFPLKEGIDHLVCDAD